ncbi:TonB-dependent receptor [Cesiribacter sp. SM1]|uniref:TonB-dependent receptor n=1 Tax=Cesiribacter sp. SM1 TaxID=2861196 RepID=UPI001CD4DD12|nr:TonB-dependent receptor [Cesiribacter sp. SM1]
MNLRNCLTISFLLILLSGINPSLAQVSQVVRGQLLQESTGRPVSGAEVVLENVDQRYQTVSDTAGNFVLNEVQPGHYRLLVQHVNYAAYLEPELLVEASKSIYRRVQLQESIRALEEVEIAAALPPAPLNKREFTIAQTQRYPATFFDPARLVLSQPGVTQSNDQANHVVVHGLSPVGIQWRLEGLPILNPNHLGNAGTRRDRASASGGGVNMLSGQLMANSSFRTGALSPRFGNAVTGVFDINLRPGNMQEREHTLQASLLGIDLATEGPISRGNSSYVANYRYSTVGLLGHMGVDFGGEAIQFQDLSASLHFENTPVGQVNFFFLGGTNSNRRAPLDDEALWEEDKDRQKIDYTARLGAVGITQAATLGLSSKWQNGVAFSAQENERSESWTGPSQPLQNLLKDEHTAMQLSAFSRLNHFFSNWLRGEAGVQFIKRHADVFSTPYTIGFGMLDRTISYSLTQPYLQAEIALLPELEMETGLRMCYLNRSKHLQLEPFGRLSWQPNSRQTWQLSYGTQSQTYTDQLMAHQSEQPLSLSGLVNSHYTGLGWGYRLKPHTTLTAELFYQTLKRLPANSSDLSWNYMSDPYFLVTGEGSAVTYGIDLNLNRNFHNGWYYQLSTSLFDASYSGVDGEKHSSPFNSQWSASLTGGKEWTKAKNEGERTWGAHLRLHSRGGYWYTPINLAESLRMQVEVEEADAPFSMQLPTYYTADIRISHTRQKQGYTRIWSLDIQNLTNNRNLGWYYFDYLQQDINAAEQLGIIPVLAYRIQF